MNILPDTLMMPPEIRLDAEASMGAIDGSLQFGARGLVVCGQSLKDSGRLAAILGAYEKNPAVAVWIHPGGEPTLDHLAALREMGRGHKTQWIAAIGGGSVLDVAKAAAGLLDAPLTLEAYHNGAPIPPSRTPFIAVPTTAGTGSEATIVSVLTNTRTVVKKSIRHPSFMARQVILDPDLLAGCPAQIIAASGMDALTQAIESYCSKGATWFTETLSFKATALIHDSIADVYDGRSSGHAELLTGSFLAGIALSHARLGLVHGLAHPLGARFDVPHGLACAVCLPHVLAFNREHIPTKYGQLSELVGMDLITYCERLLARFSLSSPFSNHHIHDDEAFIEEVLASGSTKANPRNVSAADVSALLEDLFKTHPS